MDRIAVDTEGAELGETEDGIEVESLDPVVGEDEDLRAGVHLVEIDTLQRVLRQVDVDGLLVEAGEVEAPKTAACAFYDEAGASKHLKSRVLSALN